MECKNCGAKNKDGAICCEVCSSPLEEMISITLPIWKKCPVCGYTLSEEDEVCRYCGNENREDDEEEEYSAGGLKTFIKTVTVLLVLVLLFAASFFGVQRLF